MTFKLLTEHLFEFVSLKGGCIGLADSTFFKMLHCWKAHVTAHLSSTAVNKAAVLSKAVVLLLLVH